MKIFYLPPKKFAEAVVIALILSFALSVVLAPHPVETPPVEITPAPTPKPVYIEPTAKPTPDTTPDDSVVDLDILLPNMFGDLYGIMSAMMFGMIVIIPLFIGTALGSRRLGFVLSIIALGFLIYTGYVVNLVVFTMILFIVAFYGIVMFLNERDDVGWKNT